jgi:hypothetical protein
MAQSPTFQYVPSEVRVAMSPVTSVTEVITCVEKTVPTTVRFDVPRFLNFRTRPVLSAAEGMVKVRGDALLATR